MLEDAESESESDDEVDEREATMWALRQDGSCDFATRASDVGLETVEEQATWKEPSEFEQSSSENCKPKSPGRERVEIDAKRSEKRGAAASQKLDWKGRAVVEKVSDLVTERGLARISPLSHALQATHESSRRA